MAQDDNQHEDIARSLSHEYPIYVMPENKLIVCDQLVVGYIHDIFGFNPMKANQIPKALEDLIQRYFMSDHLRIWQDPKCELQAVCVAQPFSNKFVTGGDFEWRFVDNRDIDRFGNCSDGDRLTTVKFMMHHCVFQFEVRRNKNGKFIMFLIGSFFPPDIKRLELSVNLDVTCKDIGFNLLSEGYITDSEAFKIGELMDFDSFNSLEKWTFEMKITLHKMHYLNGETIDKWKILCRSFVADEWNSEMEKLAISVWERHQSTDGKETDIDSAVNELKGMINASEDVAEAIARRMILEIERRHHPEGDYQIIPHEYLDNLLEEAVNLHDDKASRIEYVAQQLQKHLPEGVAQMLAETWINSLNSEMVQNSEDVDPDNS